MPKRITILFCKLEACVVSLGDIVWKNGQHNTLCVACLQATHTWKVVVDANLMQGRFDSRPASSDCDASF